MIYAEAGEEVRQFVDSTGIPVGETQAGKGSLPFDHPLKPARSAPAARRSPTASPNEADVVIGIGTRYTDFTTASKTIFRNEQVEFVNLNVAEIDAFKRFGIAVTGDARESLWLLGDRLDGYRVAPEHRAAAEQAAAEWRADVDHQMRPTEEGLPTHAEIIGAVNAVARPQDVIVAAAGSLPGDLHRLWRAREPKTYHMQYGYSCMGYEVAGAVGAKLGDPDRKVFAFIGDGTWLMMSQEVLTAVQEAAKIVVVLVDNQGYGSIAALSEVSGSEVSVRSSSTATRPVSFAGENLPIDLSANARSLGAQVIDATTAEELRSALDQARRNARTTAVHVHVNPKGRFGGSGAW